MNNKFKLSILIIFLVNILTLHLQSEVVVLKGGYVLEGKIIEQSRDYIGMQLFNVQESFYYYYFTDTQTYIKKSRETKYDKNIKVNLNGLLQYYYSGEIETIDDKSPTDYLTNTSNNNTRQEILKSNIKLIEFPQGRELAKQSYDSLVNRDIRSKVGPIVISPDNQHVLLLTSGMIFYLYYLKDSLLEERNYEDGIAFYEDWKRYARKHSDNVNNALRSLLNNARNTNIDIEFHEDSSRTQRFKYYSPDGTKMFFEHFTGLKKARLIPFIGPVVDQFPTYKVGICGINEKVHKFVYKKRIVGDPGKVSEWAFDSSFVILSFNSEKANKQRVTCIVTFGN